MTPDPSELVEEAIKAFVENVSTFDFETADRAFAVAVLASKYVEEDDDAPA